jgi:DNA-directed RNA polymerase I subunit RPA1
VRYGFDLWAAQVVDLISSLLQPAAEATEPASSSSSSSGSDESDGDDEEEEGDGDVVMKSSGSAASGAGSAGTLRVKVPMSVGRNPRFRACRVNLSEGWVEVHLCFPASFRKILMLDTAERALAKSLCLQTRGITRAFTTTARLDGVNRACVQTEGVNFHAAWAHCAELAVNEIDTNDVGAMLAHYGVEAARACLVKEIRGVFGAYGISVDPRHLTLIADYMTYSGDYRPMNRLGMSAKPSPFLRMSFETTFKFLTHATLFGDEETMKSPSAQIVLGAPVKGGSNFFDVRAPLQL